MRVKDKIISMSRKPKIIGLYNKKEEEERIRRTIEANEKERKEQIRLQQEDIIKQQNSIKEQEDIIKEKEKNIKECEEIINQKQDNIVKNMLANNLTIEDIIKYTGLTKDEIERLK